MPCIYLDNNATTAPSPEVTQAVHDAFQRLWANPSSVHRFGQEVRQALELARREVSQLLGCREREIIFTSGATEANNLALRGILALRSERRVVVTTPVEHSAIREPAQRLEQEDWEVLYLPVDRQGRVNPEDLDALLRQRSEEVALVSIHWANNETGVIQPIENLGQLCREFRVPFHTDATQAVGKIPMRVADLPVDALSFSAHKFHGPKGIGGLYLRATQRLRPQTLGGPQERERRGGTENVPGIIGLGAAARLARAYLDTDGPARIQALRDHFESALRDAIPHVEINGGQAPRLWNTSNLGFPPLEAEAILLLLSEKNICASAGAACSSGSLEPSPVLRAMGIPEPIAHGSVRFSLSRYTTPEEIDQTIQTLPPLIQKLRATMPN